MGMMLKDTAACMSRSPHLTNFLTMEWQHSKLFFCQSLHQHGSGHSSRKHAWEVQPMRSTGKGKGSGDP